MLSKLKRLVLRYWLFGIITVVVHSGAFRVYEIFGWPPRTVLDYIDGAAFQFVNSIQLVSHPPIHWNLIRDANEDLASGLRIAGLAIVSSGWFLLGISLPALWPLGGKRKQGQELRQTAVRITTTLAALVVAWYAIVVMNTYWGSIKSLGSHYVDCGTIGNWPPGDAREVENKRNLQAAFRESRNAKILVLDQDWTEELFIEFRNQRCMLRRQSVVRNKLKLRELDIRGWGRTVTYDVDSITIVDTEAAEDLMGRNWIPLTEWQEFLAIKVQNAPMLVY